MENVLKVEGMMCNHCKARVEKACKAVSGVEAVEVDLQSKQVTFTGNVSAEAVAKAITEAGYKVVG